MLKGLARSRSGVFKLRLAQRGAIRTCYLRHGTTNCRQQYSANEIIAHENMHKGKHKDERTGSQLKLSGTQCFFVGKNYNDIQPSEMLLKKKKIPSLIPNTKKRVRKPCDSNFLFCVFIFKKSDCRPRPGQAT